MTVLKDGEPLFVPAWQAASWYEKFEGTPRLSDLEAAADIQYEEKSSVKGSYTVENTVNEMKEHSLVMKIIYKVLEKTLSKSNGGKIDYSDPDFRMMMESSAGAPVRSIMITGGVKGEALPGLVEIANGRFFKGIAKMING